jgi:aminoglycoside 6-adenylyltransferase
MCLPLIPDPTDIDYQVKKPTESHFMGCCNEFWWCLQNVAKGIWRDELPYAKRMFEYPVRTALDQMVSWWIGSNHDFQISTGKMGKYFKRYLPDSCWEMYQGTYSNGNYKDFWDSVFIACELFRILAKDLADNLMYTYPADEDTKMTEYLRHVKELPVDAKEIY